MKPMELARASSHAGNMKGRRGWRRLSSRELAQRPNAILLLHRNQAVTIRRTGPARPRQSADDFGLSAQHFRDAVRCLARPVRASEEIVPRFGAGRS